MANNYFDGISEKEAKWLEERWSCFTGSQINRLTAKGERDMTDEEIAANKGKKGKIPTMFGKTALSYIEEVATEAVSIFNPLAVKFESRAMRNGKMNEPASFFELEKRLGLTGKNILSYCGGDNPVFIKYNEFAGVSPDVIALKPDGTYSFGAELKNPEAKTHFYYLRKMRTAQELKEEEPEYYGQTQMAMMTLKCDHWIFASYNEYMKEFADRMLIIEVPADKTYQANLKFRIPEAIKLRNKLIEELAKRRAE